MRAMRIAVLASGGGSNLGAILRHFATLGAAAPGAIVWVGASRADAGALSRASAASIAHDVVTDHADGEQLLDTLERVGAELLVLAGYLKQVPANVVRAFRGRTLNVHPALLPSFGGAGMYGSRVHEAVIRAGVKLTGVTVHFVNEEYDRGAIIAQWPVPVLEHDNAASLAGRVLAAEHQLYPRCVAAVAAGVITLDDAGVVHGVPTALQPEFRFGPEIV